MLITMETTFAVETFLPLAHVHTDSRDTDRWKLFCFFCLVFLKQGRFQQATERASTTTAEACEGPQTRLRLLPRPSPGKGGETRKRPKTVKTKGERNN